MDFQKNKKLIYMAGGTLLVVIILLCLPSILDNKGKKTPASGLDVESYWQDIPDGEKDPLKANEPDTDSILPAIEPEELTEPAYPSPSFVTTSEDTLIYKNGIYVRVGFAPEKPVIDTIEVDGVRYVRLVDDTQIPLQ